MPADTMPLVINASQFTREGYLRADVVLTRSAVLPYTKGELLQATGDEATDLVHVLLSERTLAHPATIRSAQLKPVTLTHPDQFLDAETYRRAIVGVLSNNIAVDEVGMMRGEVLIYDRNTIEAIDSGIVEVSIGFRGAVNADVGTYNGVRHEYAFGEDIQINHLAVVYAGRSGPTVRILNASEGEGDMSDSDQIAAPPAPAEDEPTPDEPDVEREGPPVVEHKELRVHPVDAHKIVNDLVNAMVTAIRRAETIRPGVDYSNLADVRAIQMSALDVHENWSDAYLAGRFDAAYDVAVENAKRTSEAKSAENAALRSAVNDAMPTTAMNSGVSIHALERLRNAN